VKNSLAGISLPQGIESAREVFYMPWLTTIKVLLDNAVFGCGQSFQQNVHRAI
jgi:hypothetical protein